MRRWLFSLFGGLLLAGWNPAAAAAPVRKTVVVIPIQTEIDQPVLYIVRRGLKEAMAQRADAVVLDVKTPGGALDATLDIIAALNHFPGLTIAYVNNEAMSAGAFISASTNEIWFAPDGIIGAAAPVTSTGQDVDATMKEKLVSYLKARMRAISEGKRYRGEVVEAMIDSDLAVTIDGKPIKEKGELLSLTATEAMKTYGQPPVPLLGAGIAPSLDALLDRKFGAGNYDVRRLEVTWSEHLAVFLNQASPVLLGLGLLALFIEFKTPGFNAFGAIGVGLLALVFLGSHLAGLSGHEPIVIFLLGAVLLLLELAFWHSAGFLGVIGVVLMAGSLLWSLADLWPGEPVTVAWSADAFVRPFEDLGLGLALAVALALGLTRFLPKTLFWDRLVVGAQVGGRAQVSGGSPEASADPNRLIGRTARTVTALRPTGQVQIDGDIYEAVVKAGTIDAGLDVKVVGRSDFGLVVARG